MVATKKLGKPVLVSRELQKIFGGMGASETGLRQRVSRGPTRPRKGIKFLGHRPQGAAFRNDYSPAGIIR
jgi:hypothetical protein